MPLASNSIESILTQYKVSYFMSLFITIYVFVYHLRSVGSMVLIGELHIKDQGSTLGLGHGLGPHQIKPQNYNINNSPTLILVFYYYF